MIRYSLFVLAVATTAATALAAVKPVQHATIDPAAITVVEQNNISPWEPTAKKLVLEHCAKEDCSDTAQG